MVSQNKKLIEIPADAHFRLSASELTVKVISNNSHLNRNVNIQDDLTESLINYLSKIVKSISCLDVCYSYNGDPTKLSAFMQVRSFHKGRTIS